MELTLNTQIFKVKWASLRLNVLIQKTQISESKAKLKVMRE